MSSKLAGDVLGFGPWCHAFPAWRTLCPGTNVTNKARGVDWFAMDATLFFNGCRSFPKTLAPMHKVYASDLCTLAWRQSNLPRKACAARAKRNISSPSMCQECE